MDYIGQTWFNEEKTWVENFTAFQEAQKVSTYNLGDFSGSVEGDQAMYTDLKIKTLQESKIKEDFYKARDVAFSELASKHNDENIALGQLWQSYENNNYTIPSE